LHAKSFLVDGHVSGVGTANLDNRSFRLNFEVTGIVVDEGFAAEVEQMFLADFANAQKMTIADVDSRSVWFRGMARAAYLTAPIQ
jgi:cardiolipin synthase